MTPDPFGFQAAKMQAHKAVAKLTRDEQFQLMSLVSSLRGTVAGVQQAVKSGDLSLAGKRAMDAAIEAARLAKVFGYRPEQLVEAIEAPLKLLRK